MSGSRIEESEGGKGIIPGKIAQKTGTSQANRNTAGRGTGGQHAGGTNYIKSRERVTLLGRGPRGSMARATVLRSQARAGVSGAEVEPLGHGLETSGQWCGQSAGWPMGT